MNENTREIYFNYKAGNMKIYKRDNQRVTAALVLNHPDAIRNLRAMNIISDGDKVSLLSQSVDIVKENGIGLSFPVGHYVTVDDSGNISCFSEAYFKLTHEEDQTMNNHRHTPTKEIPSPISEITPPNKVFYDFNQGIETIIKFIDLDLNDNKVAEHIKPDLRALRAIIEALNTNYPFTENPNNADAMERKFLRENALTNITRQMLTIVEDNVNGKYDQPRA